MTGIRAKEFERKEPAEVLDSVIDRPMVMVVAPSGYGKTTLIRQYFAERKLLSLWFPMQRDEVDGNWIWRRICNKIREYNEPLYERVAQVSLPQSEQEIAYIVRLLKTYVVREEYLIIDDYQECNSSWMDKLIENIARNVPHLHIVLISRAYPDIPYEEMFLKGYCAVINQQSLTLNIEETAQIFALNDVDLTQPELEQLYAYTDGWISAVYLSLYEYKKRGSFGSFLGVNHLLKTAIFDKLSPVMQEFFMEVSLFDWFEICGARYVTGMEIAETALFESQEEFGFLYYDAKSRSFQMHTLLRSVAEAELEKSSIDKEALFRRAAEWCEKKNNYIEAVKYYRKSGNPEKIAGIYAARQGKSLIEQAPELFEDIMDYIWDNLWEGNLMAWLNYLYYRAMRDSSAVVSPLYADTVKKIEADDVWRGNDKIQAEMLVLKSILEFNNIEKMTVSLKKVGELLGYGTSELLENSLLTFGTTCMTLLYYSGSGSLKKTVENEKEYAKYYMNLTRGVHEGWDDFFDAEYALLTGHFDRAYELAEQVHRQTAIRKQTCVVISCYYVILRCLLYQGKKEIFEKRLKQMHEELANVANPVLVVDMELVEGYIFACLGMKDRIPEWLVNFKLENCSRAIRSTRSWCMTYGKLLITERKWELLDAVGDEMLVPYGATVHIFPMIVGCIYKAVAKYNMGQEKLASGYFEKAVSYAAGDDVAAPFIENGAELKPLLEKFGDNEFVKKITDRIRQYESGVRRVLGTEDVKEVRLTEREYELMEYVRAGYRNSEIGEKMHIAQVTVEKNLTNIYRKLEVKNRTAAIRKFDAAAGLKK